MGKVWFFSDLAIWARLFAWFRFSFIQYYLTYLLVQAEEDGSDEYGSYEKASLNTTKQIINDLENIDMVIHIGDLSYANGYLSQWDQFTAQIEPIASTVPYMIGRSVQSIFFRKLS